MNLFISNPPIVDDEEILAQFWRHFKVDMTAEFQTEIFLDSYLRYLYMFIQIGLMRCRVL
jgi:hypothetical protein